MDKFLYKYLVLHKNLKVPQLGSFGVKIEPAHFDNGNSVLCPPVPIIYFSENVSQIADKSFFPFLATELGVDEISAKGEFSKFSTNLITNFKNTNSAVLEGIGELFSNEEGNIVFKPAHNPTVFLPVLEMGEAFQGLHSIKKNKSSDLWWFYAIILTVIGIGALVYYYL